MNLADYDIKRISLILVAIFLGVATFFLIRPVLIATFAGLVLAYIFKPIYNFFLKWVKSKNLSATLVLLLIIILLIVPLWFVIPIMLPQVYDLFSTSQVVDYHKIIQVIFPTATPEFVTKVGDSVASFVTTITYKALEGLTNVFEQNLTNLSNIALQMVIVLFVFYYAMRDSEHLKKFISGLSPFTKSKEKIIVDEFKNVTDSVVYGQIIIGLVQGGLAGLGLLIFGIKNVLVLTVLAIFLSILPILGPFLIWIPVTFILLASGQFSTAIGYLIYNLLIVSFVDNILRTYIVSRKSSLSPALVLVSMIGGFFALGIVGFLMGPLIISYFIMIIRAYKDKSLQSLIHDSE